MSCVIAQSLFQHCIDFLSNWSISLCQMTANFFDKYISWPPTFWAKKLPNIFQLISGNIRYYGVIDDKYRTKKHWLGGLVYYMNTTNTFETELRHCYCIQLATHYVAAIVICTSQEDNNMNQLNTLTCKCPTRVACFKYEAELYHKTCTMSAEQLAHDKDYSNSACNRPANFHLVPE